MTIFNDGWNSKEMKSDYSSNKKWLCVETSKTTFANSIVWPSGSKDCPSKHGKREKVFK